MSYRGRDSGGGRGKSGSYHGSQSFPPPGLRPLHEAKLDLVVIIIIIIISSSSSRSSSSGSNMIIIISIFMIIIIVIISTW